MGKKKKVGKGIYYTEGVTNLKNLERLVVECMRKEVKGKCQGGLNQPMDFWRHHKQLIMGIIKWEKSWEMGDFSLGKINFSGGGSNDEENQLKVGVWIELIDIYKWDSQVAYKGEYKKGQKIGRWDVLYIGKKGKKNLN
ncbi:unnamed protein product [Paramecium octaurelia]|uniref:Uncharacterized protein n=1 Tax=Paramecium octaurelia TaxID=43137 RepID=A0A8S1S0N1_PAROT|nr:unnamed protein product [Paramecium octaurelia]